MQFVVAPERRHPGAGARTSEMGSIRQKACKAAGAGCGARGRGRVGALKKPDMAAEAEPLLAGKGWLPALLRRPEPVAAEAVTPLSQDAA